MKAALAGFIAALAFRLVRRTVLIFPDSWLAYFLSLLNRLLSRGAADPGAVQPLAELQEIFACGPPLTETLRKMMREAEPALIQSAARCLARPGPYGIE